MNLEGATSIQEVIQHWRGTQPLNALVTAPQLIVISLARFQYRKGQPRKLRQRIDVHRNIFLPIFRSDASCSALPEEPSSSAGPAPHREPRGGNRRQMRETAEIQYQLLGGILHIGDRAHTGHYRMFETRDVSAEQNQLISTDLLIHDDNVQPAVANRDNLVQIQHNAYVLLFGKI